MLAAAVDVYLLTLEVPDAASRAEATAADLPADWQGPAQPHPTALLGDAWLAAGATPALRVPSLLVPDEHNLLLRPAHAEFAQVRVAYARPFRFDERLRKA
ncbi:RES family NAD+ phosphorylase [Hymenobacter caeli]|uniref:RES family NAD+ phosphorylase n=1 Tax=Hymenobacter caeli TaxID=2735894 RepID=UPI00293BAD7D|nr:RES family NAD+ phosphorylase [Hymenobacter caeli]